MRPTHTTHSRRLYTLRTLFDSLHLHAQSIISSSSLSLLSFRFTHKSLLLALSLHFSLSLLFPLYIHACLPRNTITSVLYISGDATERASVQTVNRKPRKLKPLSLHAVYYVCVFFCMCMALDALSLNYCISLRVWVKLKAFSLSHTHTHSPYGLSFSLLFAPLIFSSRLHYTPTRIVVLCIVRLASRSWCYEPTGERERERKMRSEKRPDTYTFSLAASAILLYVCLWTTVKCTLYTEHCRFSLTSLEMRRNARKA